MGKVAGVQINAGAGGAGSAVRVVMRGTKSIEKSNNVLYVIDGVPMYNHSLVEAKEPTQHRWVRRVRLT